MHLAVYYTSSINQREPMTIAYYLSTEEANYTHGYVDGTYLNLEEAMTRYHEIVKESIDDGKDGTTDYISLETCEVTLDEDGYIEEVLDWYDVIAEHTIREEQM